MERSIPAEPDPFLAARQRMVELQLRPRGISDPSVLAAMQRVARHLFVHEEDQDRAYGDHPLSIGAGQTISQPYIVASMTQELRLGSHSRVLEIGSGCGYQTAVLAEIVSRVNAVELLPELMDPARQRLAELGYDNVETRTGDGSLGWEVKRPFDGILVAAAARSVPGRLVDQLADPGRMVVPVGATAFSQDLILVTKRARQICEKRLYAVRFVPLIDSE